MVSDLENHVLIARANIQLTLEDGSCPNDLQTRHFQYFRIPHGVIHDRIATVMIHAFVLRPVMR